MTSLLHCPELVTIVDSRNINWPVNWQLRFYAQFFSQVLIVFMMRQFSLLQLQKALTRFLYSSTCTFLIHPHNCCVLGIFLHVAYVRLIFHVHSVYCEEEQINAGAWHPQEKLCLHVCHHSGSLQPFSVCFLNSQKPMRMCRLAVRVCCWCGYYLSRHCK